MRDERFWIIVMGIFVFTIFGAVLFNGVLNITGFAVFYDIGGGQTTLMLQEVDIDNLGDSYVSSGGDSDVNFGSSVLLRIGSTARIYIAFNISGIPENQNIDNASLCLYVLNTKKVQLINISHVYLEFNESNVTWNNQPCGVNFNDSSICNLTAESFVQMNSSFQYIWKCWSVENMIRKDYDLDRENISIVVHTTDPNINSFNSKESIDSFLRPYLNITYHTANTAPSVTIVFPQDSVTYDNKSLNLNYNVVDTDDNLDSCWYNISQGNMSLAGCGNITLDVNGSGNYVLNVYANDSIGFEGSDSISFSVDVEGVSANLSEPSGEKDSRTGIGIVYSVSGADECWYNVETSIGGSVVGNTSLVSCNDSNFDVSADGDYILNLFVNNSYGSVDSDSSNFSVDSSEVVVISPPSSGGSGGGGGGNFIFPSFSAKLEIDVVNVLVSLEEKKNLQIGVKNIGKTSANKCKLVDSDFIDGQTVSNIGVGEMVDFMFVLSALEGVEDLNLSIECLNNVSAVVPLNVVVLRLDLDVSIDEIKFDFKDRLIVNYSIDASDSSSNILFFRILDSDENVVSEIREEVELIGGEVFMDSVILDIVDVGGGMLRITISDVNVRFVEEDFVYRGSKGITGFIISDLDGNYFYIGFILLVFLILAGLLIRRIWKLWRK